MGQLHHQAVQSQGRILAQELPFAPQINRIKEATEEQAAGDVGPALLLSSSHAFSPPFKGSTWRHGKGPLLHGKKLVGKPPERQTKDNSQFGPE